MKRMRGLFVDKETSTGGQKITPHEEEHCGGEEHLFVECEKRRSRSHVAFLSSSSSRC